jgi:hypothetical protein
MLDRAQGSQNAYATFTQAKNFREYTARIMRDWANPISNGLRADGQPDCDEVAAPAGGTALANDGRSSRKRCQATTERRLPL